VLGDPVGFRADFPEPPRRWGLRIRRGIPERQPGALTKPLEQLLRLILALACFLFQAIYQTVHHRTTAAVRGHRHRSGRRVRPYVQAFEVSGKGACNS